MFTGIIEAEGVITQIQESDGNRIFWIRSALSDALKIDQSVSHNGVCLTVDALEEGRHRVTAIAETLEKSNAGHWKEGSVLNLERCLQMNGRIDGHIVQGHVDCTATCKEIADKKGSHELRFEYPENFAGLVIEKGSVAINGISLTAFNCKPGSFTVAIIPYTYEHTNMRMLMAGEAVNIEFDMIGKYVLQYMQLRPH